MPSFKKTCVTYIPTHKNHPMRGIRCAMANHYQIKRDEQYRVVGGVFIPWEFPSVMDALRYVEIVRASIPLSEPKAVTYDEALKYGQQEADLLSGIIKVPHLPN